MSPPTTAAPASLAASCRPLPMPRIRSVGVLPGAEIATTSEVGAAPMAAMSAIEARAARRPICSPDAQSVRKCTPSTSMSTLITTWPSGAATTAASSPGPTEVPASCVWSFVTAAIRLNSPMAASVPGSFLLVAVGF